MSIFGEGNIETHYPQRYIVKMLISTWLITGCLLFSQSFMININWNTVNTNFLSTFSKILWPTSAFCSFFLATEWKSNFSNFWVNEILVYLYHFLCLVIFPLFFHQWCNLFFITLLQILSLQINFCRDPLPNHFVQYILLQNNFSF